VSLGRRCSRYRTKEKEAHVTEVLWGAIPGGLVPTAPHTRRRLAANRAGVVDHRDTELVFYDTTEMSLRRVAGMLELKTRPGCLYISQQRANAARPLNRNMSRSILRVRIKKRLYPPELKFGNCYITQTVGSERAVEN
jgi:hypothetical protein